MRRGGLGLGRRTSLAMEGWSDVGRGGGQIRGLFEINVKCRCGEIVLNYLDAKT